MEKMDLQKCREWYDQNQDRYNGLMNTMKSLIETLLQQNGIPYLSVGGRVKSKDSYTEKMTRKNYSSPEEMMDIAGLRIITHTSAEVTRVCQLIEREFAVDQENSGDKAKDMGVDKVGYLSVHYIVKFRSDRAKLCEYARFDGLPCEIQVRSLLQHAWAEIEHDRSYKFAGVLPKEIQRKFYLVAGTLELMDQEFCALSQEIDRYAEDVKNKTIQNDLSSVTIDSTSLLQFLNEYFSEHHISDTEAQARVFQAYSDKVIDELSSFGIKTLHQLSKLLSHKTPEEWASLAHSYVGVIRIAMMLEDPETYFKSAWKNHWAVRPSDFGCWKKAGIDMQIVKKYVGSPPEESSDSDGGDT